jgi:signal peptidase I
MATVKTDNSKSSKFNFLKRGSSQPRRPKSALREWVDSVIFAVVVASLVHWLIMQPYTIPTSSMEKSLLVGDYLFVSKFHYGARTPKTILQVPLTHQTIWGTSIPSYLDWIQLPHYRLPGISSVKRNDVVVFNYPPELQFPSDLKTNYIKRCVAIAGDTIQIRNKQIYINGQVGENPVHMQTSYYMKTSESVSERVFLKYKVTDVNEVQDGYLLQTEKETAEKLKGLSFVKEITEYDNQESSFPNSPLFNWTPDNFGPLYIPKEGDKIMLNEQNTALYKNAILNYEANDDITYEEGRLMRDGKPLPNYTFKQNYYFMMGDNRHNSLDSRFWGFVPADHIVGKALFVWWSVDEHSSWLDIADKVRWNRIFTGIK